MKSLGSIILVRMQVYADYTNIRYLVYPVATGNNNNPVPSNTPGYQVLDLVKNGLKFFIDPLKDTVL